MGFAAVQTTLLFLLGVSTSDTPPAAALQDATDALNRAMQTLWLADQDGSKGYFTREKLAVSLNAAQDVLPLDTTIQVVLGPIYDTTSGLALRLLATRTEYDLYAQLYQRPGSPNAMPPGPPLACYVERLRGASAAAAITMNLLIRPTPAAGTTLQVHVIRIPIIYTTSQMTPGSTGVPNPPVPDAYIESLLLPLARWFLASSRYFGEPEKAEAYQADAQRALVQLGLADPAPPSTMAPATPLNLAPASK
jgi:hypothetical protein